jgi:hypothetical protein
MCEPFRNGRHASKHLVSSLVSFTVNMKHVLEFIETVQP